MTDKPSFGEWLKRRRLALGLTRDELARQIGYSVAMLRKVEADERRPSRQMADSLALALDVAPADRFRFVEFARGEGEDDSRTLPPHTDPPPRSSLRHVRHNLPTPPTSLLGRDDDVAVLQAWLKSDDVRLVTLIGVGGTGKTRLAVAAATAALGAFPHGVTFVDLAPIRDPALVAPTIAQTLGVRDVSDRPPDQTLQVYLREKSLLLLLDNFEQVLAAAALVADLLAAAPHLKLLVTSRAALRLRGEHVFTVEPLAVPPLPERLPLERVAAYPAVALFAQRAADAAPGFSLTPDNAPIVAQICSRLDGLPLAIELAAAHVRALPPAALLAHLDHRLGLLTRGARDLPTRQQTLRTEIGWSYDLLDEAEKTLFRRLAVFVGGFNIEAAEVVCADDTGRKTSNRGQLVTEAAPSAALTGCDVILDCIESLVAKSLLRPPPAAGQGRPLGDEPRFAMLETIREFALERLEASGEAEAIRQAHAAYFMAWAEAVEPKLYGAGEADWFARVEVEHDNVRAALTWAEERRDEDTALRLAAAMRRFWYVRGYWSEGRRWLESILAWSADGPPHGRAGALLGLGTLLGMMRAPDQAQPHLEQALDLYRALGDKRKVSNTLQHLANAALGLGDRDRAERLMEESVRLARETGIPALLAMSLSQLGMLVWLRGDHPHAERLLIEGRAVAHQGGSHREGAVILTTLGFVALAQSNASQAGYWLREAALEARVLGDQWILVGVLEGFADLAATDRPERAARLWGASQALLDDLGGVYLPMERDARRAAVDRAQAALGGDRLAALMREGATMTLAQAVAYALEEAGAD